MKAKLLLLCIIAMACIAAYYPGDSVQVQISMENAVDVKGIEVTLCDVPDYLTLSEAAATTRTLGFSVQANEISGCVKVLIFDMAGKFIPAGAGSIVTLYFDVGAGASAGVVALQLSEYIVADVNNEPLPVEPIDGALSIEPTPTPTPTPVPAVILRVVVP